MEQKCRGKLKPLMPLWLHGATAPHRHQAASVCVLTQWPQKGNLYHTVSLRLDQAGTQKNS